VPTFKDSVLVISHDTIGAKMAGPGIRYYHLARALSHEFTVTLAVPGEIEPGLETDNLHLAQYSRGVWDSLGALAMQAQTIVINSVLAGEFPQLADLHIPLAIDAYDPILAEWLTATHTKPAEQEADWAAQLQHLTVQYLAGDFYMCASERQRDWLLGQLEANGRINPWNIREDSSLRRLVDVVPYGLPETPPQHTKATIRGVWPGISPQDKVILWGGGLWPWLDPLTAVYALAKAWNTRQDLRLIFPGTRHPNPDMAQMPTYVEDVRHLATQLGLLDQAVFVGDWIPYRDWQNVLMESDVALSLHYEDTLETRWAFRTRVLDYIWAGVPIIATQGDATSELIKKYDLGTLVPEKDADRVAEAVLHMISIPKISFQSNFEQVRPLLSWNHVSKPLIEFCHSPRPAPDKAILAENLGNPYYSFNINRLIKENKELRKLVEAFEGRRIVRFLNQLRQLFNR
jgi:glycosyltransferase involved in cell wall biosynthesis